jgi:hypothetical protein
MWNWFKKWFKSPPPLEPRTTKEREKLTKREEEEFRGMYDLAKCPDCASSLEEGPHGGMSVNYRCSVCGSKFNDMGSFGVERISDACPNFKEENNGSIGSA